ncbi:MAG: FecR domain-containing protein [Prolixibacteraceae bacterium]
MERLFKKYIHAVLTPREFDEFTETIRQDKNSTSVFRWMKSEWDHFLHDLDAVKSNPLLLQKIQKIIFTEEEAVARRKLRFYSIALRGAAAIVVGLLLSGAWLYQQTKQVNEGIQFQTVHIPFGARTQFELPDGSMVWLNSGSSLTYSGNFSNQRNVELQGEAFFDVVKAKSPFVVSTPYGNVSVLGTAFNVHVYPDNDFAVTLERGSVSLTDTGEGQEQVLLPGEQIRIENGRFVKSRVETHLFTSWKEGKLIFQREPFPAMMDRLERWYNVEIAYSAGDFKELWFTGTIRDETLTEVMEMVCKAAPVNYSYNSQERLIKITARNE